MKVIDAHTGLEVRVGSVVPLPGDGHYRVIDIEPGIFHASMTAAVVTGTQKVVQTIPLKVRWMHPGFPFQHVAFVPS